MMDMFYSVKETSDHGYILSGMSMSDFFITTTGSLVKTDSTGQVMWAKVLDAVTIDLWPFPDVDEPCSFVITDVQQIPGGYILTGEVSPLIGVEVTYNDLILIKIDNSGNVLWSKRFGGSDADCGYSVKQTNDGGYIVTGSTYSFSAKDSSNIFLLKTNSSGTLLWDKTFEISTVDDDMGTCVEEVSDGYVVAGYTQQINGTDTLSDIFLLKTNTTGTLQWIKTYGQDDDGEAAYCIKKVSSGDDLLLTGYTTQPAGFSNTLVMKINSSDGSVIWSNSWFMGLLSIGDEGHSIFETSDGNIGIVGFSVNFIGGFFSNLIKLNSTATTELFSMGYNNGFFGMQMFSSGQQTIDGGYIIGNMGPGLAAWDYGLIKTDANGTSGCNESITTQTQEACSFTPLTPTYSPFTGSHDESFDAHMSDVIPVDSIFCCSPHPDIIITTVPDPATICEGESITLTADGGVDYEWSTGETTASIVVSPTNTTTYTVTANADMCPGTESIVVTVVPIPIVDAGSNTSICENTSIDLTANCSNCSGSETYEWDTGETTQVITVSPIVQTTYTVTITNQGCSDSADIVVSVMPAPTPSITGDTCANQTGAIYSTTNNPGNTYDWYIDTIGGTVIAGGQGTPSITVDWGNVGGGEVIVTEIDINSCIGIDTFFAYVNPVPLIIGDDTVCSNETVSYSTTNNFGNSYNWIITGGIVASGQGTSDITITWGTDSTGIVRVFETTGGVGCTGVDSISVFIKPSPTADAGSDITICIDSSTILTASATGGISPYTYEWDGGETDSSITVTPATATTYIITVTGDNQCTDTDDVVVTVNDPQADAGTDQIVCLGDSTILTATGAGSGETYIWNTTETTASITVSPANATTYTVTVADAIGCIDVDSVVITMGIQPVADFSADPLIIISYSNVQFTDNSQNAIYWEWDFGDDSNDTVQNPLHTYTSDGIYTVTLIVTSVDGCKDTLIKTEYIHVNAADIFIPSGFTPDDNGVNNIFSVRGAKTWDMEIYNQWGLMIYEGIDLKYPQGWDGTYKDEDQPVGNYVYIITATSMDDTEITEKGVVTLIR
jgi:gliding motility-associated-like protein